MSTAQPMRRQQPEPLLDELADRLAVAPQQPGHQRKRAPRATTHDAMNSQMFTDSAPETIDTTFIGGRCARLDVMRISTRNSKLPLA